MPAAHKDAQRNRGQHKDDGTPRRHARKHRGCAPRTKRRLATGGAEGRRKIGALSVLEKHHDDKDRAYDDVDEGDKANQHFLEPEILSERLVRKGGFEPPRLSAPPPQDGVSASSTTSAACNLIKSQDLAILSL